MFVFRSTFARTDAKAYVARGLRIRLRTADTRLKVRIRGHASSSYYSNISINEPKPNLRWQSKRFWLSLPVNASGSKISSSDVNIKHVDVREELYKHHKWDYRVFMIHPEWTVRELVNHVRQEEAEPDLEYMGAKSEFELKSESGLSSFDVLDKKLAKPLDRELPVSYPIAAGFVVSMNSQKYELPPWPALDLDGKSDQTQNQANTLRISESARKAVEVRKQLAKMKMDTDRNIIPLPKSEFFGICRISGIQDKVESVLLLDSLVRCGVVALDDANGDMIYLLAGDSDLTELMSPKCFLRDFSDSKFRSNINCVSELHELEANKEKAEMLARKRADQYFNAGLIISVTGVSILFYSTFFYLSWDIVEPVTFFISYGFSIAGYFWWFLSGTQPKYGAIHQHLFRRWRQYYTLKEKGDLERYSNLKNVLTGTKAS
mmetsp:Transcript_18801/g.22934  ORF Transcript_18801/g.22934 Transcript_18801/m.22934 type:complete len:433 (-) Transcript_18801:179-1477(-)